ncbi:GntR family transcriptional regulator [Mycolicibacterium parafortuitum]|uniref:Transcriptional regulator [Gordonia sp. KTR9] n=1 Tax=Mycolicibacterium parafortuitum TaxID=39692 RepID=A0A375YJQ2_MYCPF|nr:GntR family transcriptional regulator [Mycolicibacterium parafortuitum]SRX81375.1 Transcriptional regulator [Gordonia sp. KTR9] [Mycolicibacterium parafortuitum]
MATKPALAEVSPIEPVDITAVIATRLRDLLGEGKFAPGEQLTEASIAAAFQVSRGPVREALKRLTEQGLLVSERNRGVFVPVLTDDDVRDIYRLRGAVESAALAELVHRPRPEVFSHLWGILGRYRKALQARDWETADELDMMFHRELVYSSESRRLIHAFDTVVVETRMCMRYMLFGHEAHPDMDTWHADILEAAERGDLEAANRALEFHNATVIADFIKRPSAETPE